MIAFVLRRLLYAVVTFFGITVVTFVLIHSVPGDPISFYIGTASPRELPHSVIEAIRKEHHLDEPLPVQYLLWLKSVVRFDFGRSIVDRRPVMSRIGEKLPNTVLLNTLAFAIAALIGVPIGLWSGAHAGRLLDRASGAIYFLLYSLPSFWVALLLMRLFAVRFELLPLFGMTSHEYRDLSGAEQVADRIRHLILPVVTLTYAQLAIFARFSRAALTEVIRQDFITSARARGVGEGAIVWRHAFRNALIPLITLLGLTIPYLISGSVIVERIFQWDGIGNLYLQSIISRDYPMVMAMTIVTALVTLLASVLADLLYAVADPRVRLEEEPR